MGLGQGRRFRRISAGVAVAGALTFGLVGLMTLAEVALLRMRLPATAAGRAWRTIGLAATTTGLVAGAVVAVALVAESDHGWTAVIWACLLGGLAVVPGAVLGSLVGAVLSLDGYRRESQPA